MLLPCQSHITCCCHFLLWCATFIFWHFSYSGPSRNIGSWRKAEYRLSPCYGALVLMNRLNKTKPAVFFIFFYFRLVLSIFQIIHYENDWTSDKTRIYSAGEKILQHVRRGLPIHSNDFVCTDALRDSQQFSVILGISLVEPVLSRG